MESILGRTVEVENTFFNSSHTVKDRGSKRLVVLNASVKLFKGTDFWEQVLFSVCGPEQNNLVCFLFHMLNILPQFINNFLISTLKDVVSTVGLV